MLEHEPEFHLFWAGGCSIECVYHILFICLSTGGQLGCFHCLAAVNSAAVTISIKIFV